MSDGTGEREPLGAIRTLGRAKIERVPKIIGSDSELGNMILGRESVAGTGAEAARLLLRHIDGIRAHTAFVGSRRGYTPAHGGGAGRSSGYGDAYPQRLERGIYFSYSGNNVRDLDDSYDSPGYVLRSDGTRGYSAAYPRGAGSADDSDPQDWGRKFLRLNGACCYIDLNHLEITTSEVRSAFDFVAASRAMLEVAKDAMHAANAELRDGERLVVTAGNSDGLGASWGSHLNFLISRELWWRLVDRMLPDLFIFSAFQASSIVISGQGKVGSENGLPHADYQISQRADFIEKVRGAQTTYARPLVNIRDEPHCGGGWGAEGSSSLDDRYARLHCICSDHNLSQMATLLKVGTMQLTLAMLEADYGDPLMMLADPVEALHLWSRDPDLSARAPLADGRMVTAVELQRAFLEKARWFARSVGYDPYVPHAERILDLWDETLSWLETRRFDLARCRLDWIVKREILLRAIDARPDLDWRSPEVKHLDLLYSSLDEEDGLFWPCERSGLAERVVTDAEIERFMHQPPDDTRAWARAMLLQAAGPEHVESVNWDRVTLLVDDDRCGFPIRRTVEIADPTRFTRAELQDVFRSARSLNDLISRIEDAVRISCSGTASATTPKP